MVDGNATRAVEPVPPADEETAAKKTEAKMDMVASAVLFLGGLFVAVESMRMPTQQLSGSDWYTMPGTFPALLGLLLMTTSCIMFIKDCRETGGFRGRDLVRVPALFRSPYVVRLALALALLVAYAVFMLGSMEYMLATFIYLAVTMTVFDKRKISARSVAANLVISALVAFVVGYAFENFAQIPLP